MPRGRRQAPRRDLALTFHDLLELVDTAFQIFMLLVLLGVAAFVIAFTWARLARRRMERDIARGARNRSWGGRDYNRVRSKYFAKEERFRAARARFQAAAAAASARPSGTGNGDSDARKSSPPTISDRELYHRQTLQLVGIELTPEVLRQAYRQRIREYHPDRVAPLGIKIRTLAEEETKRINEAYKYLRQLVQAD